LTALYVGKLELLNYLGALCFGVLFAELIHSSNICTRYFRKVAEVVKSAK